MILEKLREAGISASIKKSILFADEIYFLGHTISSRGVEPGQTKVDNILAARISSSSSDIKEFLGLVNYIGQFLPGLSEWSTVLSNLTRKGMKFEWLPEHDEAFCNIKRLTKNYPMCKPVSIMTTLLLSCLSQMPAIEASVATLAKERITRQWFPQGFILGHLTQRKRTT